MQAYLKHSSASIVASSIEIYPNTIHFFGIWHYIVQTHNFPVKNNPKKVSKTVSIDKL